MGKAQPIHVPTSRAGLHFLLGEQRYLLCPYVRLAGYYNLDRMLVVRGNRTYLEKTDFLPRSGEPAGSYASTIPTSNHDYIPLGIGHVGDLL